MAYKSLFTVWDGAAESRPALDHAIRMTRDADGHLDIAALAADQTPIGFYAAEMAHEVIAQQMQVTAARAEELAAEAKAILEREGVNGAVHAVPAQIHDAAVRVGREGRFHDLAVLSRPFGRPDPDLAEAALEGALFDTLAPVLVCPHKPFAAPGARVLVAWNDDMEAMRAIIGAMPILQAAAAVEVAMVDPRRHAADRADPGMGLVTMLTRHGVRATLSTLPQTTPTVADTLLRHATDTGADMLVMGAYGHSRFRERLMGGATRDMLGKAELPVLMAH